MGLTATFTPPARTTPEQAAAALREAIEPLTNLAVTVGIEMSRTPGYEEARSTRHIQSLACAGDRARTGFDREPRARATGQQLREATAALMQFTRSFADAFGRMPGYGGAFSIRGLRRWSNMAETAIQRYDEVMSQQRTKKMSQNNGDGQQSSLVTSRKNRITGETIELHDAEAQGSMFDAAGGRWVTYCTAHHTLCNHRTRKLAESHMTVPEWCEECQARVKELVESF